MKELRDLAAKLLSDGTVKVVIGWEEGPRGVRPAFVTDAGRRRAARLRRALRAEPRDLPAPRAGATSAGSASPPSS